VTLADALLDQERAWERRPLVRDLYLGWFDEIAGRLARVDGPTVELGSGIGRLRERIPDVVLTDVEATPWTETVVDAERLPFADGSVANLVMTDVFHHVARPSRFLDETARVLADGGRLIMLEPYCSAVSTVVYKLFHRERTDLSADPFADDELVAADPLDSNQARPTLVFFRGLDEFHRRWPELRVVERRRLAFVVYPLSGGFEAPVVLPHRVGRALLPAERVLAPLASLLAFRCLVVVQRAPR
jgi:SAM-dependent methyltransferase